GGRAQLRGAAVGDSGLHVSGLDAARDLPARKALARHGGLPLPHCDDDLLRRRGLGAGARVRPAGDRAVFPVRLRPLRLRAGDRRLLQRPVHVLPRGHDVPPRRVPPPALADAYGPLGTIGAVVVLIVAVGLGLRFDPRTDAYVAVWLALSPAAALYEFAYDQLLPLVPLVIATGLISRVQPLRARLFAEFGELVIIVGATFLQDTPGAERGTP